MKTIKAAALAAAFATLAGPVAAKEGTGLSIAGQMILYEQKDFNGDTVEIDQPRTTLPRFDWNIRSIAIHAGEKWEVCAKPRFRDCIVLDRSLPDASVVGITGGIGSARQIVTNP
ncbi:MAG: beta/gamma crystallin-related protein [Allosphingosinicella sp.]